jgi:hypothetical protein
MELKIVIIKNKNKGVAAWVEGPDATTGKPCRIDLPSVQVAVTLTKHLSLSQTGREDCDGGIKYSYSLTV